MKKIIYKEQTYAIHDRIGNLYSFGTTWYGDNQESIQVSRMSYNKGKKFRTHIHKLNPRIINRTQECFIILKGKVQIDIYNVEKILIEPIEAKAGDVVIVYRGYHGLSILEDNTIIFEIKAGRFTSVEEDKENL